MYQINFPEWVCTWEDIDKWFLEGQLLNYNQLSPYEKYAQMYTCDLYEPYMKAALTEMYNPYVLLLKVIEWKDKVQENTGRIPERFTAENEKHQWKCVESARWN